MDKVAIQRIALAFGIIFSVIGVCGFVPMFTSGSQGDELLFAALATSPAQNSVYIATGLAGIACSFSFRSARSFFIIAGAAYSVLSLVGFFQGDTVLGLYPVNLSNNLLNYTLAIAGVIIGFWQLSKEHRKPSV